MTREITSFQKKSAMTLASCSNPSRNGMLIRLDALCAVAAVYQGAHPCRYLPVGSGHSTLIKVSSIRSGGIGNRPITRASALSTPWASIPSKHPFLCPSLSSSRCGGKVAFSSREEEASSLSIPPGGCQESKGTTRVRVVIRRLVNHSRFSGNREERTNPVRSRVRSQGGEGWLINRRERGRERVSALYLSGVRKGGTRFDQRLLNRGTIVIMITEFLSRRREDRANRIE